VEEQIARRMFDESESVLHIKELLSIHCIAVIISPDTSYYLQHITDTGHAEGSILFDMSSVLDAVDHSIMIDVSSRRYDLQDNALSWFQSYCTDHSQGRRDGLRL
jgi:hypothetical protein